VAPQRPSAARIEAGHELTASGAGGDQVLVSLREAAAELLVLLGEVGHLLLELADVIGLSEAGLAPDLLAGRPRTSRRRTDESRMRGQSD
jgi:hypothetical protein